ncbi:hypothetical protein GCM10025868_19320 [Angustibacter aerolatus]|uniref:NAD-dependent epimerase/dehydratase domain-containing protein n=1 Tax=Angustibacter aerolatus TaxID=1162965 RepID=A0ABQ6JEP7_9ACTN|nr:NAD-dependent epimerase/dehydratase family protein [Angustibacter aerolatus]GMA86682.1 hypothetical protein GCM10025868_19320 [Angustibacter aerolatus]
MAAALLTAVERTGADYVMLGNTYGYGPVEGPMTEDLPMSATTVKGRVRAQMWQDALAAHEAGRVRVTEVRSAGFLGPGPVGAYALFVAAAVLAGEEASYPGDLDAPHTWNYTEDIARTLVAASGADRAWGRAWHVPATSSVSVRRLTEQAAEPGWRRRPSAPPSAPPGSGRAWLGRSRCSASLLEMLYSNESPHILDSAFTQEVLGVRPTPLDAVLRHTLAGDHPRAA